MTTSTPPARTVRLPSGEEVALLGQGTWRMGDHSARRAEEIRALELGIDLGLTLLDTAEMYGDGAAEELVGAAIASRRSEVFLVSKVLPQHATRRGTIAACEASLRRLRTSELDLYLLHWRGSVPLEETLHGFEALVEAGKVRRTSCPGAASAASRSWPTHRSSKVASSAIPRSTASRPGTRPRLPRWRWPG